MKLLFDQNLSFKLCTAVGAQFPGSGHVREVGMAKATDSKVWDFARANGFLIVSKDNDFQARAIQYGHPPKVIWIRLGNCATAAVATLLRSRHADIEAFGNDPKSALLELP